MSDKSVRENFKTVEEWSQTLELGEMGKFIARIGDDDIHEMILDCARCYASENPGTDLDSCIEDGENHIHEIVTFYVLDSLKDIEVLEENEFERIKKRAFEAVTTDVRLGDFAQKIAEEINEQIEEFISDHIAEDEPIDFLQDFCYKTNQIVSHYDLENLHTRVPNPYAMNKYAFDMVNDSEFDIEKAFAQAVELVTKGD